MIEERDEKGIKHKRYYKIGEIAKLFQVDVRTLRYYDDIGLLKPDFVDGETGYRYYSVSQFEPLNTIRFLRSLDMSIKDIQEHLETRDVASLLRLLSDLKWQTEQKLKQLEIRRAEIKGRLEQIQDAMQSRPFFGQVRKKFLTERKVVVLKQEVSCTDDLEIPIRILENSVNLKNSIFLGKVGLLSLPERLYRGEYGTYDGVFLRVEQETGLEIIQTYPEGPYLSICFQGTHSDAPPYYEELLRYCEAQELVIRHPTLEITYIDGGLSHDPQQYVTEIQLYVGRLKFPTKKI